MSNFDDFFGGGGAFGAFPVLKGVAGLGLSDVRLEGYSGDGDSFQLPSNQVGTLTYRNAAGSTVFTKTVAQIEATADMWISMMLDSVANLFYCVVSDNAASPETLFLASVDIAGTVNVIGSDTFDIDTVLTSPDLWFPTNGNGAPSLIRATEGSGDFLLQLGSTILTINSATGAISSTETFSANKGFRAANGVSMEVARTPAVGTGAGTSTEASHIETRIRFKDANNVLRVEDVNVPLATNFPSTTGVTVAEADTVFIQWKGDMVFFTNTTVISSNRYTKAELDAAVTAIATNRGIV